VPGNPDHDPLRRAANHPHTRRRGGTDRVQDELAHPRGLGGRIRGITEDIVDPRVVQRDPEDGLVGILPQRRRHRPVRHHPERTVRLGHKEETRIRGVGVEDRRRGLPPGVGRLLLRGSERVPDQGEPLGAVERVRGICLLPDVEGVRVQGDHADHLFR
jgi:hypothetical protein